MKLQATGDQLRLPEINFLTFSALTVWWRFWPEVEGSRPTLHCLSYSRWFLLDTSSACHISHPLSPRSEPTPSPPSGPTAGNPTGRRRFQPPGYRLYREGSSGGGRHSTQPGSHPEYKLLKYLRLNLIDPSAGKFPGSIYQSPHNIRHCLRASSNLLELQEGNCCFYLLIHLSNFLCPL